MGFDRMPASPSTGKARRIAVPVLLIGVLGATGWVCLIGGLVALLRPVLGLGWGFLVVAAVLLAVALLAGLVLRLSRPPAPLHGQDMPEPPADLPARLASTAVTGVMDGLSDRRSLRPALLAAAIVSAGLALILPEPGHRDDS